MAGTPALSRPSTIGPATGHFRREIRSKHAMESAKQSFIWGHCLALALGAGAARADGTNPIESAGCRQALEILQAQEAVLMASRRASEAGPAPARLAVDRLRRNAARACLGGTGEPPPPKQIASPPISVSPIVVPRPAPRVSAPSVQATPPPRRIEPQVFVSACDAGGCWASDGTRLIRSGAHLIGPRGMCSGTQGTPLNCPP
jgi:hypothetical protein